MNVILVDDEALALEVLERLLLKIDDIHICGKYTDAKKALLWLENSNIDVVFLDLEMGGIHGLEFAEELISRNISTEIVFVTAYTRYAIDAFEVAAADYLLKPVSPDRLSKTVKRLKERMELKKSSEIHDSSGAASLFIRSLGTLLVYAKDGETLLTIKWRTKKVKELFCYLWQNNERPMNKYVIMEELWPEIEIDRGGALLHTTVYQLRKVMKELGCESGIQFVNNHYRLEIPLQSDLEELQGLLEVEEPNATIIGRLLELYEGDYLEKEEYTWSIYRQQTIRNAYLKYLKQYLEKNINQKSRSILLENCLHKMIQIDQYNEEYIYLLLTHYAEVGNVKGVIKLYEEHYKNMREELGINPSRNVVEFYINFINNK